MNLLKTPIKQPKYRGNRTHTKFLTKLNTYLTKNTFIKKIKLELQKKYKTNISSIPQSYPAHRKSTKLITMLDL